MSIETIRGVLGALYERAWSAALCGDIDNKQSAIEAAISTVNPEAIRAEARAEALKDAADRAIDWYVRTWKVSPVGPCADELRAAILADEPKERRSVHCRECSDYDVCTRPELKMALHRCAQFDPKEREAKGPEDGDVCIERWGSGDRVAFFDKHSSNLLVPRIVLRRHAEVVRKLKEADLNKEP